jgi:hypothetical protein
VRVLKAAAFNAAALKAAAVDAPALNTRPQFGCPEHGPSSPKSTLSHTNHNGSKGTLNPSGPVGFLPEFRGFCKFFLPVDSG